VILATVFGNSWISPKSPNMAFRRYVYFPIPKSVKNIKVDRHVTFLTHRYVFNFLIDKSDISKIIKSKPFKEFQQIEYSDENGVLTWGDNPKLDFENRILTLIGHGGFELYNRRFGEHTPEWFKLDEWKSPKVYVFSRQDVTRNRVLVYNEELGEAYFIDYRFPD
jgi:hypothetical protein